MTRTHRATSAPFCPASARNARNDRSIRMTPAQLVKDDCANLLPGGACLGVSVESLIDTGRRRTAVPRDRCGVADGERCSYFERVILPLSEKPSPLGDSQRQVRRAAARLGYESRHVLRSSQSRCPDCGNPRPARHRYCESCAARHRREATKRRVRRYRQPAVPL